MPSPLKASDEATADAAEVLLGICATPPSKLNGEMNGQSDGGQQQHDPEQQEEGATHPADAVSALESVAPVVQSDNGAQQQQPPSPSKKKEEEPKQQKPPRKSPEKTPRRMSSLQSPTGGGTTNNTMQLKQPPELLGLQSATTQPLPTASQYAPPAMTGTIICQPISAPLPTIPTSTSAPSKPATYTQKPKTKASNRASKTLQTLQKYKESNAVTQFLSGVNGSASIDFNQRISVPGTLLDIANRVTDNGGDDTPLSCALKSDEDGGDTITIDMMTSQNNDYAGSFASKFPTLAPPMSFQEPATNDAALSGMYDSFLPSTRTKKKRRREEVSNDGGGIYNSNGNGKKSKKKRGRKSDIEGGGTLLKRSDFDISHSRQYQYEKDIRILPDPTPKPKSYIISSDMSPQRIHNPLLALPQFPMGNDPPLDEIPTGGELWNMTNLVYCDGDTFPINYLGRILGFDIPKEGRGVVFGERLDVESLELMKEDGCFDVPGLGSFVPRWEESEKDGCKGDDDDAMLSYCDPLWVNILQTYRGYNEQDFKDAGKGYAAHLSPLVLEFAKERGVVNGEEVSFRMALAEDEAVLLALEERCMSKCTQRQDLAALLKTPGVFFIIAESAADKVPVAFVQYRFCWYKVEEKKAGINQMTAYGVKSRAGEAVDKVSELVFFIDNVIYDDCTGKAEETASPTKKPDVETTRVLLMSLALIHAWSHNIWYGMMEAPDAIVPFYAKYFRMVALGKQSGDDAVTPLVCDLKKCSFRYAIYRREESMKSSNQQSKQPVADQTVNQRMLVHMPTTSNTSFSNTNNSSQLKNVQIRIDTSQQTEHNVPDIMLVSAEDDQESTTKIDVSSFDNVAPNWNLFKLFSTNSDGTAETMAIEEDDFFVAELKKKQNELKTLEASIEKTSRFLLGEAYNDALDFQLGDRKAKKEREKQVLKDFEAVKQRLHEADLAWQAQLEQDMDAVCDVCWDGEVTPENQIIFCDSCNVAVHQGCYGIDRVPSGNYFCHPCIHNGKNNEFLAAERQGGQRSAPSRTPVICELCPRRQGAFVQTETAPDSLRKPRWVHVGCAKWSGLNYVDIEKKDMIENVAELKDMYEQNQITCVLCKSGIGAMHQCRHEGCNKWLHLTCARCVGTCSVQHGENCEGLYPLDAIPFPPWTLACLEHSEVDPETIRKNSITVDQLKAIAKSYPPEPIPPKPFIKLNAKERREYWADKDNLQKFVKKVQSIKTGAFCSVCALPHVDVQCDKCGTFFHGGCVGTSEECHGCIYAEKHAGSADYKPPKCKMCKASGGPVLEIFAKPGGMKKWRANKAQMTAFKRSLFGPNNFCHVICGYWNPECKTIVDGDDTVVNASDIVMAHGNGFVREQNRCIVCSFTYGAKVSCSNEKCKSGLMHVTCARAAGFEVAHSDDVGFFLKCFHHSENANNLRARLEDMLEVEIGRSKSKKFDKGFLPMSWDHAASLFHSAVGVLRVLGWAWRWADWWVAEGDNWEPLLEDDQNEADMTEEELKIIRSTPESRCDDARVCRLAAFGAALRNRDYDKVEGGDDQPLERALKAVLSVPSLVGPLKKKEIEFFALWLGIAYRSKSPLLGFGDDKIPVADKEFCLHIADGSPKYELGSRPLPGLAEPENAKTSFEPLVEEVDDFLQIREQEKPKSKGRKTEDPA